MYVPDKEEDGVEPEEAHQPSGRDILWGGTLRTRGRPTDSRDVFTTNVTSRALIGKKMLDEEDHSFDGIEEKYR
ncbi:hypothetical protein FRB95_011325 [Tulasnella sp. JGI-2019a]|nr:hypothetical protein FRB95_011325 [Tulasnella sp. JGI-2019a]